MTGPVTPYDVRITRSGNGLRMKARLTGLPDCGVDVRIAPDLTDEQAADLYDLMAHIPQIMDAVFNALRDGAQEGDTVGVEVDG